MNNEVAVTIPNHIMPILKEMAEDRNLSLTAAVNLILNEWALNKLIFELKGQKEGRKS